MVTQSSNLNLTFPSRNVPEESLKLFVETKNAAQIYSMLELIRSVQRSVTNRTDMGFFFLARIPETLPLKFHPISYIKAMTKRKPNLETDHSHQTNVRVQNAWKRTSASPKHFHCQLYRQIHHYSTCHTQARCISGTVTCSVTYDFRRLLLFRHETIK
jgi:hypothetical protein